MSSPVEKLIRNFCKLPGIGEKSAARLVFFLLRSQKQIAKELSEALKELHEKMRLCSLCCNVTDADPCSFCQDSKRDPSLLCVVEDPSDLKAIEKTYSYKGLYHVLHGALSPLEGIGPDDLKIAELLTRLKKSPVHEIILATNANVEGDATSLYLTRLLKPMEIKITRLASGIPVGGELEFIDPSTLSKALAERREIY